MAERIKVGIVYKNDENWIGGSYYIKNLIAALNTLTEQTQPAIVVLAAAPNEFEHIQQTGYPHLTFRKLVYIPERLKLIKRILNKLTRILKGYVMFPQPFRLD